MITNTSQSTAVRQYADAYETHYACGDLREAFAQYQDILLAHPDTVEAGFARSQIQTIVNAVVSKEARLKSQIDLAAAVFAKREELSRPVEQSGAPQDS